MRPKFEIRLTDEQREELSERIAYLRLTKNQKQLRRALIIDKADSSGANWSDTNIAKIFRCSHGSISHLRKRFCENGFHKTLYGDYESNKAKVKPILGNDQLKEVLSLRQQKPPDGHCKWTLRLLADKSIELGIVESVSYETIRKAINSA